MRIRFIISLLRKMTLLGACQSSHWLRKEAKRSAKEGKTAREIADRLGQLFQVLLDWRNEVPGVPSSLSP